MPPEFWNAASAIVLAILAFMFEMMRRSVKRGKEDSEIKQEEIKDMVRPVSNGFARDIKELLSDTVAIIHDLRGQMVDLRNDLDHIKGSQIDLHRRLDQHLEDHVPKQRRRGFFR